MIDTSYLKNLRKNVEFIQSYHLKVEMNLIEEDIVTKSRMDFFDPWVSKVKNSLKWHLLPDVTIDISNSNINNLHKFVDYMEKNIKNITYSNGETIIKQHIIKYITEVGIT